MKWNLLEEINQLPDLIKESTEKKILIFKHSTRCSISRAALDRLERNWDDTEIDEVKPYFLDLLAFRNLSNSIAEQFGVEHQSPQVMIIRNGKSILDRSHFDIDFKQLKIVLKN